MSDFAEAPTGPCPDCGGEDEWACDCIADDARLDRLVLRYGDAAYAVGEWHHETAPGPLSEYAARTTRARGALKGWVRGILIERDRLRIENARLRVVLADMVDEDECWYDHHGYCQAHAWLATEPPCPHKRAKEIAPTPEPSDD